jgi:hypothetical protein
MRAFYTALAITALGFTLLITDTHKTAIATVWPYIEAFWDYQAR